MNTTLIFGAQITKREMNMKPTLEDYIAEHIRILNELAIWCRLSAEERTCFISCTTETQIDRLMHDFRHKYIK